MSTLARVRHSAWLSWTCKGALSLTDQALIGSSNFLVGILLARQLSSAAYGAYAVVFEIFLIIGMAYACLVLEPMLVFGPSDYRDRLPRYFGSVIWIHFAGAGGAALLVALAAGVLFGLGKSPLLPLPLLAVAVTLPVVLLFWLARRVCYVTLDPAAAVRGGLLYGAALLTGLVLLYRFKLLSPSMAFLLIMLGSLAALPVLIRHLRPVMFPIPSRVTLGTLAMRHWGYGRWALAAAAASWVAGNIYYFPLSSMHGLASTGAFKALQNLGSPVGQVFSALFTLTLPYAARRHKQSDGGVSPEAFSWRLTAIYAGGALAYWAVFFGFQTPILKLLYAGKYLQFANLIPYIAAGSVFRIATTAQMISLKADQAPFLSFVAWLWSAAIAVCLGIPAIWVFGLQGALWAYVLSGAIGFAAASILLRRMTRAGHAAARTPEMAVAVEI